MFKLTSSRNPRTKELRVKHVLQICLFVAVCIWLLYQVNHSHDEERSSKISNKVFGSHLEILKFGRKDLPQIVEIDSVNETRDEEEENEESDEAEQETKQAETDDEEGRYAGDGEIDEQDQERADEEAERGEEYVEEDKDSPLEGSDLLDNQNNEGGESQEAREKDYKGDDASSAVSRGTQMAESESGNGNARSLDEEQMESMYKEDVEIENEANSSKSNDSSIVGIVDGSNDIDSSVLETMLGSEDNDSSVVLQDNVAMEINDSSMPLYQNLETNSTMAIEPNNQMETQNNSTVVDDVVTGVPLQNETISLDSVEDLNATAEMGTPEKNNWDESEESSTVSSATNENGDGTQGEPGDTPNSVVDAVVTGVPLQNETISLDSVEDLNATAEMGTPEKNNWDESEESSTVSSATNENGDGTQGEPGDTPNSVVDAVVTGVPLQNETISLDSVEDLNATAEMGTPEKNNWDESEESSTVSSATNENGDGTQGEPGDTSNSAVAEEERDASTDLSTLPEIRNEAKNVEDEAAE